MKLTPFAQKISAFIFEGNNDESYKKILEFILLLNELLSKSALPTFDEYAKASYNRSSSYDYYKRRRAYEELLERNVESLIERFAHDRLFMVCYNDLKNISNLNKHLCTFIEVCKKDHVNFKKELLDSSYEELFSKKSYPVASSVNTLICKLLELERYEIILELKSAGINFFKSALNCGDKKQVLYFSKHHDDLYTLVQSIYARVLNVEGYISYEDDEKVHDKVDRAYVGTIYSFDTIDKVPGLFKELTVTKELNLYASLYASERYVACLKLLDSLRDCGLAINIMLEGDLLSSSDAQMRRYLVSRGAIKKVITLAPNLFAPVLPSAVNLMVLSGLKESSIQFVDASSIFTKDRRKNVLSDENIARILELCQDDCSDTKYSTVISNKDLLEQDKISLNPLDYLQLLPKFDDAVTISDIQKSCFRGPTISAKELDDAITSENTSIKLLRLNNVAKGFVDDKLCNLKDYLNLEIKNSLQPNDLLIPRFISNSPTVVYEANVKNGDKTTVIPTDNFLCLRLDSSKVNPYYLELFFNSPQGLSLLKQIAKGSSLKVLAKKNLLSLQIPLPPLSKQNELVQEYLQSRSKLITLCQEVETLQSELRHFPLN